MSERTHTSSSRLAKNTLINIVGMLLPLVVGLAAIPYIIKGLGNELFGVLTIAWAIIASLTLLDFGIGRATTKFASENMRADGGSQVPEILWTALVLNTLFGIVGGVLFYLAIPIIVHEFFKITPESIDETVIAFKVIAWLIPFLLITNSLKGILSAAQRFDFINYVTIPVNSLSFIIPIFSIWGMQLSTIMLCIIAMRIIATFIYLLQCWQLFPACKIPQMPHREIIKKLSSYGMWITVSGIINPVLVYVDRFLIGSILSMEMLTFYAAPMEAIQRLRILPNALMITLFPEFSAGVSKSQIDMQYMLFGKSFKTILMTTGLICLSLFVFSEELIHLWLGVDYVAKSAAIVKIVSISIVFNFLALVPFTFLQGIGRPDLTAKFHLFESLFYFFLLGFLIRNFGLVGAAYAWSIRIFVDFLLLFLWSGKFLPGMLQSLHKEKVGLILVSLLIYAGLLLSAKALFLGLHWQIFITASALGCMTWYYWNFIVDEKERSLAKNLFGRLTTEKV
ncbi:MAG: flippase [Deferribacteres bacterium]|nr:flippase [candidate division KSB1 bacterium]MCB9500495.1 flippase [Deferribacteres bacterium]